MTSTQQQILERDQNDNTDQGRDGQQPQLFPQSSATAIQQDQQLGGEQAQQPLNLTNAQQLALHSENQKNKQDLQLIEKFIRDQQQQQISQNGQVQKKESTQNILDRLMNSNNGFQKAQTGPNYLQSVLNQDKVTPKQGQTSPQANSGEDAKQKLQAQLAQLQNPTGMTKQQQTLKSMDGNMLQILQMMGNIQRNENNLAQRTESPQIAGSTQQHTINEALQAFAKNQGAANAEKAAGTTVNQESSNLATKQQIEQGLFSAMQRVPKSNEQSASTQQRQQEQQFNSFSAQQNQEKSMDTNNAMVSEPLHHLSAQREASGYASAVREDKINPGNDQENQIAKLLDQLQNQNSNSETQRTLLSQVNRTNNVIMSKPTEIGKSLSSAFQGNSDLHSSPRKLNPPLFLQPQPPISQNNAQSQFQNVLQNFSQSNNQSQPALLKQIASLLNKQGSNTIINPQPQTDVTKVTGANSPQTKGQMDRNQVLSLQQMSSSNQHAQILAQIMQQAQLKQRTQPQNQSHDEDMKHVSSGEDQPKTEKTIDLATDQVQAVESSCQANQQEPSSVRSISQLNTFLKHQQNQFNDQRGIQYRTFPNAYSDDEIKSLVINNSTVSACNGSGGPIQSVEVAPGSSEEELGLGRSQVNNVSDESAAAQASILKQTQVNISDKQFKIQAQLQTTQQLQSNQFNNQNSTDNNNMLLLNQRKVSANNLAQTPQQTQALQLQQMQQKLQMIKNQNSLNQQNTNFADLQKQLFQQASQQAQQTTVLQQPTSSLNKPKESAISITGGESNLTTLMSSNHPAQSNNHRLNLQKQVQSSPPKPDVESLQTQIKTLVGLLGLFNGNGQTQIPQNQQQRQVGAPNVQGGVEATLKNSLSPQLMDSVMQIPGVNKILSGQSVHAGNQSMQQQQTMTQLQQILNMSKPNSSANLNHTFAKPQPPAQSQNAFLQQLQSQMLNQAKQNIQIPSSQCSQNRVSEHTQQNVNQGQLAQSQLSQLSQQLKQISQMQGNMGMGAPQIPNNTLVQAIQAIETVSTQGKVAPSSISNDQMSVLAQLSGQQAQNIPNQMGQQMNIQRLQQMLTSMNGGQNQDQLAKLTSVIQGANRNGGLQSLMSSDLKAINELNWEDDDYNMSGKPHQQMDSQNKYSHLSLINPMSKRIKKTVDGISISQLDSAAMCTDGEGPPMLIGDEKIHDKGDYFLIHRLNSNTKRMNQILQCKKCPLKFPKLCNLRDHLRIHNDDMPFKCKLCHKPFTQAGNRDRHEKKRVCQKRERGVGETSLTQQSGEQLKEDYSTDQQNLQAQIEQNQTMNADIQIAENTEKLDAKMTVDDGILRVQQSKIKQEKREDEGCMSQAQKKENATGLYHF